MKDYSRELAEYISEVFSGAVKPVPVDIDGIIFGRAKVLQLMAPSCAMAVEMLKKLTFCHLRWELLNASKITFKRLPFVIKDDEPLRFFIPFVFCEPAKRWYRFAPFYIELERWVSPSPLIEVNERMSVRLNAQVNICRLPETWEESTTHARIIIESSTIQQARFAVRLKKWGNAI